MQHASGIKPAELKKMVDMLQVRTFPEEQPTSLQRPPPELFVQSFAALLCVCSCLGLVPGPFQGGPRHSPALVLHHYVQCGQTLHEEQAAGEGMTARMF